jgi:hypothetical protein
VIRRRRLKQIKIAQMSVKKNHVLKSGCAPQKNINDCTKARQLLH